MCIFKWFFKATAQTDENSHRLHLYDFSPKWVFKCFLKSPAWIDAKLQMLAFVRFFFNCLLKLSASTDAKSHWLHLNDFSPEIVFRCFLKRPAWIYAKSHLLHLYPFFNCLLKLCAGTDAQSHWLHLYPFSPEWVWSQVNLEKRHTNATLHLFRQAIWGSV